jgi:hypothetical protein
LVLLPSREFPLPAAAQKTMDVVSNSFPKAFTHFIEKLYLLNLFHCWLFNFPKATLLGAFPHLHTPRTFLVYEGRE